MNEFEAMAEYHRNLRLDRLRREGDPEGFAEDGKLNIVMAKDESRPAKRFAIGFGSNYDDARATSVYGSKSHFSEFQNCADWSEEKKALEDVVGRAEDARRRGIDVTINGMSYNELKEPLREKIKQLEKKIDDDDWW